MRKVVYGGACSLDGYLARTDGAVDWLMWSDEAGEIMQESWSRFDTMLMGRKTYEAAMKNAPEGGAGEAADGVETYVFTTTLDPADHPGVRIVNEGGVDLVKQLREGEGKDICVMGGGLLARSLFEADLIDEVGFNVHPLLLGSGVPSFHTMGKQIDLELIDSRILKNGCVYVLYNVRH